MCEAPSTSNSESVVTFYRPEQAQVAVGTDAPNAYGMPLEENSVTPHLFLEHRC